MSLYVQNGEVISGKSPILSCSLIQKFIKLHSIKQVHKFGIEICKISIGPICSEIKINQSLLVTSWCTQYIGTSTKL